MSKSRSFIPSGLDVSRETIARLDIYESLLRRWQSRINLISAATLPDIWTRHFVDSLQVLAHAPTANIWADMGSGAGFPGLVMAIQLIERSDGMVHLIESDNKKCAFLREVARETGARAEVHRGRIEDILPDLKVEGVTARALAPLPQLLGWAGSLLKKGATGVFLKGQDVEAELTAIAASSRFKLEIRQSDSNPSGKIVVVTAPSIFGNQQD